MKLSVSLPDEDVKILDAFVRTEGLSSRSAAVHRAVQLLRHPDLEAQYLQAWQEWEESGASEHWEVTAGDGMRDAAR